MGFRISEEFFLGEIVFFGFRFSECGGFEIVEEEDFGYIVFLKKRIFEVWVFG